MKISKKFKIIKNSEKEEEIILVKRISSDKSSSLSLKKEDKGWVWRLIIIQLQSKTQSGL